MEVQIPREVETFCSGRALIVVSISSFIASTFVVLSGPSNTQVSCGASIVGVRRQLHLIVGHPVRPRWLLSQPSVYGYYARWDGVRKVLNRKRKGRCSR